MDLPRPSSKRLTQVLQLLTESRLAHYQSQKTTETSQTRRLFKECSQYMREAIEVADTEQLIFVGAESRLLKARVIMVLISTYTTDEKLKLERDSLLDWVIRHRSEVVQRAQRERATAMKSLGVISEEEKRAVIQAVMNAEGSTNPAGHLYECPNGHEYWVGECGGAMQQSRCMECGAVIGGLSHQLATGNRRAAIAVLR